MSTNSNFKKNKCWSCEFFCGHREYKKSIFFGDSVVTDGKGNCSNNRSSNYRKSVYEDGWCNKFQKWGVLLSAIEKEEKKRLSEQGNEHTKKTYQNTHNTTDLKPFFKRLLIIFVILVLFITIVFMSIPFIVEAFLKN